MQSQTWLKEYSSAEDKEERKMTEITWLWIAIMAVFASGFALGVTLQARADIWTRRHRRQFRKEKSYYDL